MVEENVEYLEAGKSIKHCANQGKFLAPDEFADIYVRSQGGDAVFQRKHHRHRERHKESGKQYRQPEKWAADEIEGVGSKQVRTEIGVPVPAETAASYSIVSQVVERYLLGIKVTIVDEVAIFADHDGNHRHQHHAEAQQKRRKVFLAGIPEYFLHYINPPVNLSIGIITHIPFKIKLTS